MSELSASKLEQQLDAAYSRVLWMTLGLGVIGIAAGLAAGWRSSLGVAAGACLGALNLVWLHRGAEVLVRRMMANDASAAASKLKVMLFFPLRYLVVMAAAYAILKGYPGVLVGFIAGLALPMLAMMGEGIYEAVALQRD
jgi:ATP synthase I subunit